MKAYQIHCQLIMMMVLYPLMFTSCASFSNKTTWQERKKLTVANLKELEGAYSLSPNFIYSEPTYYAGSTINRMLELGGDINQYLKYKKIDVDSLSLYRVFLSKIQLNRISIVIKKEQITIDSLSLPAKLHTSGFVMVGKPKMQIMGIPYLFGSFASEKSRVGMSSNGDLIFNHVFNYGGGLLLIIGIARRREFTYRFTRISH